MLIFGILAGQTLAIILICSGLCFLNNQTARIDIENAIGFATNCFQNTTLKSSSENSAQLYLDSTSGSCTDEIYEMLNEFMVSIGGVDIAIPCQSKCSALDDNTEATIEAAADCFSYFSPPILAMTPEEMYDFYANTFVLQGQCTYRQYNEREQAIRKYLIDPLLLDTINSPK
jgi:hypothetical protein